MPDLSYHFDLELSTQEFLNECSKDERKELLEELLEEFDNSKKEDAIISKGSLADSIRDENLEKLANLPHDIIEKLVEEHCT